MKVQCESCKANGQVSDEAELRAVLWICGSCGVRYLVSSRGIRKAPLPPPPPKERVQGLQRELPPRLLIEGAIPETVPPSIAENVVATDAPTSSEPSTRANRHSADIPIAKDVEGTPGPSPVLFHAKAPVPSYPVLAVPVSDPLWRRPALLASALAGLLVGLAAYGVQWTRDQVKNYEPSVATAAAAPQESPQVMPIAAESEEAEAAIENQPIEPSRGSELAQPAIERKSQTQAAPPPSKVSARSPAPRSVTARTRASEPISPRAAEPVTVAAVAQPEPEVIESPKVSEPSTLGEALARAARPPAGSEAQAKAQPESNAQSASLDGYTPFSRDAALSALSSAAASASRCRSNEGPFGTARLAVTFAPSGQATSAIVEGPPFAGTPVGSCLARTFREARVTPFSGAPVTVRKTVSIF